jgi:hypothetical protein
MVRKGSRFSNLPSSSPSPSGEPRAEAQSRGSVGELPGGRVNALTLPFWAKKFHLPFPIDQACCRNHLNLASKPPLPPTCLRLCASSPDQEPQCLQLRPNRLEQPRACFAIHPFGRDRDCPLNVPAEYPSHRWKVRIFTFMFGPLGRWIRKPLATGILGL